MQGPQPGRHAHNKHALSWRWARNQQNSGRRAKNPTKNLNLPRSKRLEGRGGEQLYERQPRGGIAVYVADALAPSVTVLLTGPQNCYALLRIDGVVGQGEDAFLFACYIPPHSSPAFGRVGGPGVWIDR